MYFRFFQQNKRAGLKPAPIMLFLNNISEYIIYFAAFNTVCAAASLAIGTL